MAKLKNTLKYILIFLIAMTIFSYISFINLQLDADTFWNYHFIQKTYNGFLPYKDFNIIITPLFHYIGALFLQIIGNKMYVFSIYAGFEMAIIFMLCSKIINILIDKFPYRVIALSALMSFIIPLSTIANYNIFMLIFPLAVLIIEQNILKDDSKKKSYRIIEGILLGLMVLTKQSTGAVFSFVFFIYLFFTSEKKARIKTILPVFLSELLVGLLFIIYLLSNNNFLDFFNYCFGGMIDFGSKNIRITEDILPVIFCCIMGLPLLFHYKKEKSSIDLLYYLYIIASSSILYPLANTFHILVAFVPIGIVIIYAIKVFCRDVTLNTSGKVSVFIAGIILSFLYIGSSYYYLSGSINYVPYTMSGPLSVFDYCAFADIGFQSSIRNVLMLKEEKEKEGYTFLILSSNASYYAIPLSENNGDFDLLLNGNIGYKGTEKVINQLSQIEKPFILKADYQFINFQEIKEIEEYVVNNYKQLDEKYDNMRVFVAK